MESIVTLEELERSWSLDDVYRANSLLDMRLDMERMQAEKDKKRK